MEVKVKVIKRLGSGEPTQQQQAMTNQMTLDPTRHRDMIAD